MWRKIRNWLTTNNHLTDWSNESIQNVAYQGTNNRRTKTQRFIKYIHNPALNRATSFHCISGLAVEKLVRNKPLGIWTLFWSDIWAKLCLSLSLLLTTTWSVILDIVIVDSAQWFSIYLIGNWHNIVANISLVVVFYLLKIMLPFLPDCTSLLAWV